MDPVDRMAHGSWVWFAQVRAVAKGEAVEEHVDAEMTQNRMGRRLRLVCTKAQLESVCLEGA